VQYYGGSIISGSILGLVFLMEIFDIFICMFMAPIGTMFIIVAGAAIPLEVADADTRNACCILGGMFTFLNMMLQVL